jgi:branched-chain amino acid transport system substrate-binding protein
MAKKALLIPLVLLLAICLVVIGCPSTPTTTPPTTTSPMTTQPETTQPSPEAKTLRIGHLECLTGFLSVFDIQQDRETQMVAQMINEAGGITVQGQKYNIELVTQDVQSTFDGASAAANKLVYDENLKFVVGPFAFFDLATSPIFEGEQVLHVSSWHTLQPGEMDETTPYGFLGFQGTVGEFMGSLEAMRKFYPEIQKMVFAIPDDGSLPFLVPVITKLAVDGGYTVVGDTIAYPNEIADFSPVAAKINAAEDADAIFLLNAGPPQIGGIVKGVRELGNTKPIIRDGNVSCYDILAIAGAEASTNIMTGGITPNLPDNPPMINEIYNRLLPEYGDNALVLSTANSLYVLLQAIEAAQSLDPTVVRDSWENMDAIGTLFGVGYMGGEETFGIRHAVSSPHSVQQLIDGEIISQGWIEVGAIP